MDDPDDFCWGGTTTVLAPITNLKPRATSQHVTVLASSSGGGSGKLLNAALERTTDACAPLSLVPAAAETPASILKNGKLSGKPRSTVASVASLEAENERLREELAVLNNKVCALQVDLVERAWSSERAKELGTALDLLSNENLTLRAENEEFKNSAKELNRLKHVQLLLLQAFDASADPFLSQQLLLKVLSGGHPSSSTEQNSPSRRNQQPLSQPAGVDGYEIRSIIAAGFCKNCIVSKEERLRADMVFREKSSRQQVMLQWDIFTSTHQFSSAQVTEVETEQMWQEDMLAHRLSLETLQQQLNHREATISTLQQYESEAAMWKFKYNTLKEAERAHVDELKQSQEHEIQQTRLRYLRINPNMNLVRYLSVSCIKTHFNNGKLMIFLGNSHRKVLILRHEMRHLRDELVRQLEEMKHSFEVVIRKCVPMQWSVVDMVEPSGGTAPAMLHRSAATSVPRSRSSHEITARAPVLSPKSRNATVVVLRRSNPKIDFSLED